MVHCICPTYHSTISFPKINFAQFQFNFHCKHFQEVPIIEVQLTTFSVEFYIYTLLSFSDDTLCGDPEQPLSSIVNQTSPTTVEYTCLKGYKMTGGGDRTRTCSPKGVWEGRPPMCSGQTAFQPFDFIYTQLSNTRNWNTMNDPEALFRAYYIPSAKAVCGASCKILCHHQGT